MGDLGGLGFDELGVAAQLRHAGFEAGPGPGGGEEEQHRQHLVVQQGMGPAQGALQLEVTGHLEHGVELVFAPVLRGDEVPSPQMGLHRYSIAPSTSASSAIRITTP